jgi:hypothetical protein
MNWNYALNIIAVVIATAIIMTGAFGYMKSFHSVDLAYNMCLQIQDQHIRGENMVDYRKMYDTTSNHNNIYLTDVYIAGHNGMFKYLVYVLFGMGLMGFAIRGLLEYEQNIKHNNKTKR